MSSRRTRPKSLSQAPPGSSRMLAGLTSRWTVPLAWAKSSASAMSDSTSSASARGSGPVRATRSASVSPGTRRIEMKARPPISPAS